MMKDNRPLNLRQYNLYVPDLGQCVKLTPRDINTLHLLSLGLRNSEVAQSLNLSQHGVEWHIDKLRKKLNCQNIRAMVALFVRSGLQDAMPSPLT